jgi:hypothetical protein
LRFSCAKQAAAYRKLATKRAEQYGLAAQVDPKIQTAAPEPTPHIIPPLVDDIGPSLTGLMVCSIHAARSGGSTFCRP